MVILLIAFVVVSPEDLPKVAIWLARLFRRFRSVIKEIREQTGINALEHELSSTKNDINRSINTLKSDVNISGELGGTAQAIQTEIAKTDEAVKKE